MFFRCQLTAFNTRRLHAHCVTLCRENKKKRKCLTNKLHNAMNTKFNLHKNISAEKHTVSLNTSTNSGGTSFGFATKINQVCVITNTKCGAIANNRFSRRKIPRSAFLSSLPKTLIKHYEFCRT